MTFPVPRNPQPVRREPSDPRSFGPSTAKGGAVLLTDSRSTRRRAG